MVDPVAPDQLALDQDRRDENVYVDQRPVLARPPGDQLYLPLRPAPVHIPGLGAELVRRRDEVIDETPGRFLAPVAEELLGRRVPGRDPRIQIDGDDRGRANLK